ncbi:MAG: transcription termination/antitermination protein NusA [Deltaproteobacteria bacterium]|nr:transcription termination/antitermination protein NusA [Deltaproteobacteria bacterium]
MILDIGQIINQLGKEKGIDRSIIIGAIKDALESAAKKKYGMNKQLEAIFDEETGGFEILEFRTVVEEVTDPEMEILLAEALELDPEARANDNIGFRMSTKDLGRIAAQTARQIIMQKVKDAEREVIYNEFITRKGEILNGIVQRYERDTIIVDLGRTEAVMPPAEQIPRERYRQGDRIRAYIKDVTKTSRGPEILLSRSDPRVILKFFEQEVPEVYEGVVSILSVAREPGFRTKIAVKSKERDVDPVGACVGMKGSRVQSVVQELRGERIDIIAWDEDPAKFVCNALQPAEIIRVLVNESEKTMEVIVPEEQLLLAIGKRGQNVKLAAKLVGWKIEVRAEGQVQDALKKAEGLFAPKEAPTEADGEETPLVTSPEEAKAEPDASGSTGEDAPEEGTSEEAPKEADGEETSPVTSPEEAKAEPDASGSTVEDAEAPPSEEGGGDVPAAAEIPEEKPGDGSGT